MATTLVFISGASSGIGLAMAQAHPFDAARIIDISRRGAKGIEHHAADLSDPAAWPGVADLFLKEMKGFQGERVVFVHSAGTLEPMGYAGEVDAAAYTRQVLLNAAAPQVLGAAFVRAARETQAPCFFLNVSSGAANKPYRGWSAYCGGKAAGDHWVRTVGFEQSERGHCHLVSIAPGIIETAMQEQIRATDENDFPDVERFRERHLSGSLRSPEEAARDLWESLERGLENGAVVDLRNA
jgi:benzil reductase ((S)-benzoin forming)